jgi:hypothetical protein
MRDEHSPVSAVTWRQWRRKIEQESRYLVVFTYPTPDHLIGSRYIAQGMKIRAPNNASGNLCSAQRSRSLSHEQCEQ